MRVFQKKQNKQKGAVLLTTILLMSVMAVLAVAIIDDVRFNIKRAKSVSVNSQMGWYLQGGEEYAHVWLKQFVKDPSQLNIFFKSDSELSFPIDGGQIKINLKDGRNCFNVNRLTKTRPSGKPNELQQLQSLIKLLQIDTAESIFLAAKIKDWVDSDNIPEQGGAEDLDYLNKTPPYHAANTMMKDITELREIDGIDESTFQKLRPVLCALPQNDMNKYNINSLQKKDWPLLAQALGSKADNMVLAKAIIAKRPEQGYASLDEFWEVVRSESTETSRNVLSFLAVNTDLVIIDLQVQIDGFSKSGKLLYKLDGDKVSLVARREMF